MSKILITGGTGFVGTHLCTLLLKQGHDVVVLSRKKQQKIGIPIFTWNYEKDELEEDALQGIDYIVHLAGENIGHKRWTSLQKKKIYESRVMSIKLLARKLKEKEVHLKAFISASAIGYYGSVTSEHIFSETDPPASDFLGEICQTWEKTADTMQTVSDRVVKIRTGIVLSPGKEVYEKIVQPLNYKLIPILGNGKQYMPWVHIDDLCRIYLKSIEDKRMQGVYNAVAPHQSTYAEMMSQLKQSHKGFFLKINIPSFVLHLFLGEKAKLLLQGSRISADKIIQSDFKFEYSTIPQKK